MARPLRKNESGINADAQRFLDKHRALTTANLSAISVADKLAELQARSVRKRPKARAHITATPTSFHDTLLQRAARLTANGTRSEWVLQAKLRHAELPFLEQQVIGWYIVDIVLPERMAILECDGMQHLSSKNVAKDMRRTEWLQQFGFRVIRFANRYIDEVRVDELFTLPIVPISLYEEAVKRANDERDRLLTMPSPPKCSPAFIEDIQASFDRVPDELEIALDYALYYDRS